MDIKHLSDLTPDPKNARRHNPRNIGMIERALNEVGAARSIVVDEAGVVLAGNGLVEAAAQAGIERVRVVDADGDEIIAVRRRGLTEEQKTKLALYDNRTAELADWEPGVLAELAQELDLGSLFTDLELSDLAMPALPEPGAGGDEFDSTPDDGPTRAQLGDLWLIGGVHRLLVGDCTDPANVARLMGGERADMVFTDPPYGVDYEGGLNETKRERLAGDTSAALYGACMSTATPHCKPSAPWYIWFAGTVGEPVYTAVSSHGYKVRAMIVWNKLDAHYGNFMAQYMQKHEPCLYVVKDAPPWHGPTNEVTVWDVKQPSVNEYHPTQKPLELAERAMRNSSVNGALVCDWFLGSGTTLIAAHRTGRRCYGMEIAPRYADVILRRAEAEGLTVERAAE